MCLRLAAPSLKDKRIYSIDIARKWLHGKRVSDLICAASEQVKPLGEDDHLWNVLRWALEAQLSDQGKYRFFFVAFQSFHFLISF